jgi:hypothetical protein
MFKVLCSFKHVHGLLLLLATIASGLGELGDGADNFAHA